MTTATQTHPRSSANDKPIILALLISLLLTGEVLLLLDHLGVVKLPYTEQLHTSTGKKVATVVSATQPARRRSAEKLAWSPLLPNDEIHVGDTVITGNDGGATLRTESGTEFTLSSGSLVSFNEEEELQNEFAISFDQGQIKVVAAKKEKIQVKTNRFAMKLDKDGAASMDLSPFGKASSVSVERGAAQLVPIAPKKETKVAKPAVPGEKLNVPERVAKSNIPETLTKTEKVDTTKPLSTVTATKPIETSQAPTAAESAALEREAAEAEAEAAIAPVTLTAGQAVTIAPEKKAEAGVKPKPIVLVPSPFIKPKLDEVVQAPPQPILPTFEPVAARNGAAITPALKPFVAPPVETKVAEKVEKKPVAMKPQVMQSQVLTEAQMQQELERAQEMLRRHAMSQQHALDASRHFGKEIVPPPVQAPREPAVAADAQAGYWRGATEEPGTVPVRVGWGTFPGAELYEVQVSSTPDFGGKPSKYETQKALTFLRLKSPGTYYWRVRAKLKANTFSSWSDPNQLLLDVIPR